MYWRKGLCLPVCGDTVHHCTGKVHCGILRGNAEQEAGWSIKPQWPTSSSRVPPPKGSTASQNSTTSWDQVSNTWTRERHLHIPSTTWLQVCNQGVSRPSFLQNLWREPFFESSGPVVTCWQPVLCILCHQCGFLWASGHLIRTPVRLGAYCFQYDLRILVIPVLTLPKKVTVWDLRYCGLGTFFG